MQELFQAQTIPAREFSVVRLTENFTCIQPAVRKCFKIKILMEMIHVSVLAACFLIIM